MQLKALIPALQDATSWNPFLKQEVVDKLEELRMRIEGAIPYCVCKPCGGKGCEQCRTSGWVPDWKQEDLAINGSW